MRSSFWLVLILGCGNSATKITDGAVDTRPIDARTPDAMPDALIDAPPAPLGAHRYVMDHETVPTAPNESNIYGLDLNNDGIVDNAFGMVEASLGSMGLPVESVVSHGIDIGSPITLVDLAAADLTTATTATATLYTGANAMPVPCNGTGDTTCRHHLAGTGTFDIAATSARDTALTGAIAANVLTAGPGTLHFPVTVFGSTVTVQLIAARVKLTGLTDTAVMSGIVAGGIPKSELDTKVFPAIAAGATAAVAVDCNALTSPPGCGCTASSTGATYISLFDTNQNCAVTTDEIASNSLIMALFATDLTVGNTKAMSFGVGITAIHAAFTP